jgi:hypothetical protein
LTGGVEHLGGTLLRGWALSSAHPNAPLCLDVLVDGTVVAQTLANQYRVDLSKAGIGSGHHGFAVELPAALLPLEVARIEVRRSTDGAALTPFTAAVKAEIAA